jgi:opacity protein-like surface antigen
MRKLLLLTTILATPCFAADLPLRKAAPVGVTPSPFYVFLQGGAGFTNTQSDITIAGVATGTPKIWPAGAMVGGGFGYLSSVGPLSVGLEAEGDYDFTKSSISCTGVIPCMGSAKNSWFFAEKVLFGITLSQIAGYIPGSAQPANWPMPITVPSTFTQNVMLLGEVGMAQRTVDLCALDITGTEACGSQWKNGLLVGAQARMNISQNASLRVEYNWIDFNQTFTPASATAIFADTVSAKNQQRLMAGFNYNF